MALAYVSSRYHRSLSDQFYLQRNYRSTDDAKLMVLFLSILGRSGFEANGSGW